MRFIMGQSVAILILAVLSGCTQVVASPTAGPATAPPQPTPTLTDQPTDIPPADATPTASPAAGEPLTIVARGQGVTAHVIQARPGDALELYVARMVCCVFWEEVEQPFMWSVEPSGAATIDGAGRLVVGADVASGTILTVSAMPESGPPLAATIYVYTLEANPFVGQWMEEMQFDCQTGAEVVPATPIRELVFFADNTFQVTWFPFEAYVDYTGRYFFDLAAGTLTISAEYLNYLPDDLDGDGTFSLDEQGRLVLSDIWLGTPPPRGQSGPPACGHRFARAGS